VGQGALRGRRLLYALLLLGAATISLLVLGLVFPERFLSPDDTGLLHAMWGEARWDLPALGTPTITLAMGHEAVIGAALALLALGSLSRRVRARFADVETSRRSPGERVAAWVIVGLALAIALPWLAVTNPQGLGFRVRIVAFVPMALCAAIAAPALELPFARAFADLARRTATWERIRAGVLVVIALAIVLAMPTDRTEGRVLAHPAMVAAVEGLAGRIPEGDIAIVPERHIAFMVTWYTGVPFRMRPEGVARAHRWRVMPLAFIGIDSPLDQLLMAARREPGLVPPVGTHPRHPNGLVLVAEPTWEWILARLPPAARDHFTRWPTI
jgi:hypothetical protein